MAKRFFGIGLAAALGCGALTAAEPAYAQMCADPSAREALEMRVLQSELMVAALTCGERQSYNAFVTTFKPYLQSQGAALRGFFAAQYGPSAGPAQLNKMVTRLANAASQDSYAEPRRTYCNQAKERFAAILQGGTQHLARIARTSPTASAHGYRSCVEVAGGGRQSFR